MESFAMNFIVTMLALGFVLAVAWVALRFLKGRLQPRGVPGRGDDALRFVRALPLGTKERVVIVEHRGERWMLGVTSGGISTIAHWGESPDSAESHSQESASASLRAPG